MNPSRRDFVQALAAVPLAAAGAQASAAAPPNVLLILTDDQGYGDLGCTGNPILKTPNLDSLHDRSVRFTNFHVSPTCAPTRAALMTGRYSNATGVWHTIQGRSLLRPGEATMADSFRASGYRTGIFGKWHLGDNYPCRPQDRGFDETAICGGGGVWQTPDYFGNDYFDDTYLHNGKPVKSQGYCTDVWFDLAMNFMSDAAQQQKPFFCYLPTNAAHVPYWAPEKFSAPYKSLGATIAGFFGMIANIDHNMARMQEFLDVKGLSENTIVVFSCDNGTAEGVRVFNAQMRGAKSSPYEGGHRVPFFIRWPRGGLTGGRNIDTLASHIDVLPTLAEFCHLKLHGNEIHGQSLRPLLQDTKANWPDRAVIVDSQRSENLVKWKDAAVMTQQWRLVQPGLTGSKELYEIAKDPGQQHDIAAEKPDVVKRLTAEYDRWWKMTSARSDEYVRIVLGNSAENPSRLTAHDWHGDAEKIWNQRAIRMGPVAQGFWAVDIDRAGKYRIELRRWPKEVDLPVNAPFHDATPNHEKTPGAAIHAVKARLKMGDIDINAPVHAEDKGAMFEVSLPRGPAELQTWFYDADGTSRGAYYVYIERG